MAIKKRGPQESEKKSILRVTIPEHLSREIKETKKLCRLHGFVFDIKPDIEQAIRESIDEAKRTVNEVINKT